jgi:hypothetical protein
MYSFYSFLTSALDGVSGQCHAPADIILSFIWPTFLLVWSNLPSSTPVILCVPVIYPIISSTPLINFILGPYESHWGSTGQTPE